MSHPDDPTQPLLANSHPPAQSIPGRKKRLSAASIGNTPTNNNNRINNLSSSYSNSHLPSSERHWSEDTEDIEGPDPSAAGHQNTGAGYRRRGFGRPAVNTPTTLHYIRPDLDAERFSGREPPRGLKKLFYSCCCYPCANAWASFTDRYSRSERIWMGIAGVFFLLTAAFFAALVKAQHDSPPTGQNGLCGSRECVLLAADILRDMKPEVDPCKDFYQFACGGFLEREEIPDGKPARGQFNIASDGNVKIMHKILTADPKSRSIKDEASRRNLQKLQQLFNSCMDEKKLTEVGRQPLYDLIQKLIKTFPADGHSTDNSITAAKIPVGGMQRLEEDDSLDEDSIVGMWTKAKSQHPVRPGLVPSEANVYVDTDTRPYSLRRRSLRRGKRQVQATASIDRDALTAVLAQLNELSIDTIVGLGTDINPVDPTKYALFLYEGGLGLPSQEYYLEDKVTTMYQDLVTQMLGLIIGSNDPATSTIDFKEMAKDVVDFEKKLAAIGTSQEDQNDAQKTNNPRTIQEVSAMLPAIDWPTLVKKIAGKQASSVQVLIVTSLPYLEKLNALLKETQASTLQNYFVWSAIRSLGSSLSKEFREPLQRFNAILRGTDPEQAPKRWETCVDVVSSSLGAMLGHYYVEEAFPAASKEEADGIIKSLRSVFYDDLGKLEWLDEETLKNARTKVDLLEQKAGYSTASPDVKSPSNLEDWYKDLGVDPNDFFGNRMRSRLWSNRRSMEDIGQPVDRARWGMDPQEVNAYYNPLMNEIVFPAGILQPPFFKGSWPEYLNFGGIGAVAGHELTHAFDNNGRLFNATGFFTNWWTNKTEEEFEKRAECFVEEYGNFTVKDPVGREVHVNGRMTLGENLADDGGVKKSFEAWSARFKEDPKGKKYKNHLLLGLENYTREQLFFISYARVWCNKQLPDYAVQKVRTDVHSPPEWRVNGVMENNAVFAQAFRCKPRTAMNPDHKCNMW
ncbi:hypothetical protein BGW42_003715 [Actinomortierella wolfii]|nr:hypothetical protein BGW42_003715 [Actinomortierella wolfii]